MYFTFSSGAVRDAGRQSGGEARGFGKERVFGLRGLHFLEERGKESFRYLGVRLHSSFGVVVVAYMYS